MPDISLANKSSALALIDSAARRKSSFRSLPRTYPYVTLAAFLLGVFFSYVIWGRGSRDNTAALGNDATSTAAGSRDGSHVHAGDMSALIEQVNPAQGYALPISYGDLGPRLIAAGVIDPAAFEKIYQDGGKPLSREELSALKAGSGAPITITAENAHFLLNFFWAVGLANRNPILMEGPMVTNSDGRIDRYASTGGWGLAARPVTEIYSSLDLVPLTAQQQRLVEAVAAAVYRPCCNNATIFPDCNHGMAMLGVLELMASEGATADEMFAAAKEINAFWFPQQTLETAVYMKATQNTDFVDADARLVVGEEYSSGAGSARIHQALQTSGLLQQTPGQGNGCAN